MSRHTPGAESEKLATYAQEMYVALVNAVEALRATEVFMCGQGLETNHLNEIIRTIDELLDRAGGQED